MQRVGSSNAWAALRADDTEAAARFLPAIRAILPAALAEAQDVLAPTGPEEIVARLTPVLVLVAGVGMGGAEREAWLAAAADALRGCPPDLFDRGLKAARATVDHPSKIVAAIMAEVKPAWQARLRDKAMVRKLMDLDGPAPPEPYCTAAQAAEIIDAHGLRTPAATRPGGQCGPPRAPTAADLAKIRAAMGLVDNQ